MPRPVTLLGVYWRSSVRYCSKYSFGLDTVYLKTQDLNIASQLLEKTMNVLKTQLVKQHDAILRYIFNILGQRFIPIVSYTTTVDCIEGFDELIRRRREKWSSNNFILPDMRVQQFVKPDCNNMDISSMTDEELDKTLQQLLIKNKDKQIEQIITECIPIRKLISDVTMKNVLKHYANAGKPDMIATLQKYCAKTLPNVYKRNGEFNHYLAKAQCYKGNSEKGLSILKESFIRNENLRSFYRLILKDLIQDSVLNRSEASLVVFKKYVLEFSTQWEEHYPLVCFWHICWLSSWYSDQLLSDELWDTSRNLREIVGDKVGALSMSALKADYNEDAVVRLLQTLLKYDMMDEYTKVLEVLFSYKLRNRDLRGCSEIIRNCEVLGITLPSNQQGRYIKMLITGAKSPSQTSKDFKLKF